MRSVIPLLLLLAFVLPGDAQDVPASGLPRSEQLTSFDPLRVEVAWGRDGWNLKAGDQVLKEFGRRQVEAYEALRLIRDLNLTERGAIGGPTPILEYWLSNGQAPSGSARGQRALTIDRATLRVEGEGGQYCVRDAQRVLFNFGYAKEEAEQALGVIRKYNFSRILLLGQATPTMMVFQRDPTEVLSGIQHTLHSQTIRSEPIKVISPKATDEKTTPQEVGSIQKYVPASIPALHDPLARPGTGPAVPGVNDRILRVPFDWRQAQLRRDPDGWMLYSGSMNLGRFGTDEMLARKALLALQFYRFSELCLVGAPTACAHFYLVGGMIPHGELFGVPAVPLNAEQLTIQKQGTRYVLAQGSDVVLLLGDRPEDARQLLDWLQRHKPERLARLTSPDGQGMTFFFNR
jgi:hypothetical protein